MRNVQVEIFVPVSVKATSGQIIRHYGYSEPIPVAANKIITASSVQPRTLSPAEIALWGIGDRIANSKTMFFDPEPLVTIGNRVRVDSDKIYDVMSSNLWERHQEAVLLPIQGGTA